MLERTPIFETGPRFFERDGKPMFEHRVDSRNVIGPREVVKSDVERFPKLWDRFIASRSEKTESADDQPEAAVPFARRRGRPPKVPA